MTQITFTINDESKLSLILNWLKNQDAVRNVSTQPISLTAKQLEMKENLEASLLEVELHRQGKIKLKTWAELTPKQLEMKNDLQESLEWAEKVQRGEIQADKDVHQLLAELEDLS